MKKQIYNLSVLQNAKFMAVLYLILSIPFLALFFLFSLFVPGSSFLGSLAMLIFGPILYAIGGFIFTAIATLVYNFVANLVGGIEYASKDVGAYETPTSTAAAARVDSL